MEQYTRIEARAMEFAMRKHRGQMDDAGKDYFLAHCLVVGNLLKQVGAPEEVVAAGFLHDTIEDAGVTYHELRDTFTEEVADLVMEVTHEGQKDSHGYYFPNLHSKLGIMIKFADHLSNLSRIGCWPEKRQLQFLRKSKFWKSEKAKPPEERMVDTVIRFRVVDNNLVTARFEDKEAKTGVEVCSDHAEEALIGMLDEMKERAASGPWGTKAMLRIVGTMGDEVRVGRKSWLRGFFRKEVWINLQDIETLVNDYAASECKAPVRITTDFMPQTAVTPGELTIIIKKWQCGEER